MTYYYFGASLPSLSQDTPPPMSPDQFKVLCGQHLGKSDLAALSELDQPLDKPANNSFVDRWNNVEISIRNAVVRARAARRKLDPEPHLRPQQDWNMERAVSDAMAKTNPLEREHALDRIRWKQAEELGGFSPFTSSAILSYAVKLKIASRWAGMSEEKGSAALQSVLSSTPSVDSTVKAGR